ncbi:WD repeat and FYVE domain-containing protein 3 isoform X2 [Parasteatoda tepidariorum]|uniref:WD repeat and FYVE domain-containing protein 3 isoform X2 n=1 Tax=Parasteatoda tepidariorum TaxID=114398 RepID=UPI001C720A75|nr:WD repeat and FYVE domain-containing protein 3 isoform X2 [Parasteatoda tepidariorum]
MNIMRKLLVGHSRGAAMGEDPPQSSQHTALGLMHLHKLFSELVHSPHPLSQTEQEQRLYNMLPLFCKVFGNCPSSDMIEKFSEILSFCQLVSRLMVSEIRRRASNQSTEAASCAIAKFLEISSTEELSNGWMLLTAVNLLAAGNAALVDIMTASSLPSTLVKCLYLFFDLPPIENPDDIDPDCEFSPKERRILLQKVFVQVLVRLCSHSGPAEELSRKDDLALLFSAITSWCPAHNTVWRKSAAEVLMTLSRHGLSHSVVSYIHNKACIALCIENMQRVQELSPLEIVEMFVTVFCFLKDSSEVSQMILDDFRTCQGYIFLSEFLLRLEQNTSEEACEALRNIVLLIASLTSCGYIELKPSQASTGSLFTLPGFQIPHSTGASVRNLQAFQVIQSVFMKAQTPYLCSLLLDAVSTVYHSDKANYFILESQHTLSQFSEKIHTKPTEIQEKFFKLLEFIIFDLNFVPCKEFISLSILLKTQNSTTCSMLCLKSLLNILHSNSMFKDVYREVGLLEVLVTCLHRYAAILKEAFPDASDEQPANWEIPEEQLTLGSLVMEALTALLNSNSGNASVFRESGGARCAHNMVPYHICRQAALGIVQQLVLSNGGDDDMGTLLGLMHTAPVLALDLKTHILKSLLYVLRESHRTRTVFRKVGGFVYVMSVLVSMEGCLADPPKPPWNTVEKKEILILLRTLFHTLAMAMRYEPANARFFASEICHTSLTDTVRLLGCFSNNVTLDDNSEKICNLPDDHVFHLIFSMAKDTKIAVSSVPTPLISSCLIFRLLYDTATDAFDKPNIPAPLHRAHSETDTHNLTETTQVSSPNKRSAFTMNFTPPTPDAMIVHPGVVVSMHHLLPSVRNHTKPQMALTLQCYLTEVLRSLVRSERNQQVMCESGLPGELLVHCHIALENESHSLHPPLQYIFERLSAQSLEPKDLREFLRLGSPLCCTSFDEDAQETMKSLSRNIRPANHRDGGPVPLTRVKTLVSMTTPRDCRLHGTSIMPPFVEFDMSSEGFSCLYLPSVAPQSVSAPAVVGVGMVSMGSDVSVIGGIGTGDRVFPPQTGLTYSTWVCSEKFSDPHSDPHAIRLLTLVRNIQGRDEQLICLSIQISSRDKALLISTTETMMHQSTGVDWEPEEREECCVRIWCPELLQEGQWHHLAIILNRAVLKNSSVSVYVDGQHHSTQKLHYISQNPGGGAANLTVATSIFGFIGTPPQFRRQSKLLWKQGPCHLVEEVFSPAAVSMLYQLGPCYTGSFQAPTLSGVDVHQPLVAEEKIVFGINAAAVSVMTLAKIRRVYSKADCRSIAKMLGMSSHENATPIHILHNSGGHLSGPARCLGGILVGYLGARTFVPHPVSLTIDNVGGTATLLGLVAMAKDVEGLYAAVKALVCVVKSNRAAQQEMDRMKRYQTLAMLFKKKRSLLNSHILHLTFSLVGTVDSGRENTSIPNVSAFEDLLCDLEVWQDSPGDLQKSLYEHFCELVAESSEHKSNLKILRDLNMVSRLLQVLKQLHLSSATCRILCRLLCILLQDTNKNGDIKCFGQFIAATIPVSSIREKEIEIKGNINNALSNCENKEFVDAKINQNVLLRNHCLALLCSLFSRSGVVNYTFCETVVKCLGFDWVLLFLQEHLHPTTVIWGLRILSIFLSHQHLLQLFRESSVNGGWLAETDAVLNNRVDVALGFNMSGSNPKSFGSVDVTDEAAHVPGFQHLQYLMVHHVEIPEVYFLLLSIMLGLFPSALPPTVTLTMDVIWSYLFGAPTGQNPNNLIISRGEICQEAAVVALAMIRTIIHMVDQSEVVSEYAITLLHFFISLYHNRSDFVTVCMGQDVIAALVASLFPPAQSVQDHDMVNSPLEDYQTYNPEQQFVFLQSKNSSSYYDRDSLTTHSARKFVMDFLRVIVVDSFSLPPTPKHAPVIDLLLEAIPIDSTHNQQCEFQMDILSLVMDHLLAADVLLGEQAAMPIVAGGSYSNIVPNVFYFTSCLVDKLWQGVFAKDSHKVLDFIIKLIAQAKRKGSSSISFDSVYRSLNRTILYQLSRTMESVVDQMVVLEGLQKIAAHKNIVIAPANHENEFFGCLCYCLLLLTEDPNHCSNSNQKSTWHVPANFKEQKENKHRTSAEEAASLISNAANRVWEELYISRRQVLEEFCKVQFSNFSSYTSPSPKVPTLECMRGVVQEPMSKLWHNYLESERKQGYTKETWQFQTQFQTKLQKVTGGLSRLASRKMKKDHPFRAPVSNVSYKELELYTSSHVSLVRDLVEFQSKQHQQNKQYLLKYVFNEWLQTEAELTRERALWGSPLGTHLDKWMLDMTEGPCRMRKKMVKNELFYIHYPYRPEVEGGENRALKYKVATSFDSKEYYKRWRPENMVEQDTISVDATSLDSVDVNNLETESSEEREIGFQGLRAALLLSKSSVNRSNDWDEDQDISEVVTDGSGEQDRSSESSPENQNILRLLEDGEKITHMFRCARIQGLDTCEGLLLFGKEHFYVVDGFTLLKTREIRDIDSLPVNMHDPIIPNSTPMNKHQKRMCSKFSYDEIKDVHKRRYLLQPIALEVFSADGRNYLLAFPRKIRNKVYARFLATATAITDSAQESLAGQKRTANVESSANLLSSLIGDTSVTQRWVRGEISNFQYLMHLNTLAGRSYNDLMQYPVFPWILADYDSEELDLNDQATFRDFTKPMGAQTPDRLHQFLKRFKEWDDPHGETPPYHYGTFYSSAMIVASYLVRMEPFTQHFLHLQGGHFDLADRMFHSIKDAWLSAAKHNMADVKELIPEFFYLPEFLLNSNNFDLGSKQNGVPLNDIVLPPWAKNDPREFIRVHRQALECDFVSTHLHEWIDLIFGYKQQGTAAVEAVNVFHHLFYEGNVDIYSIDDPLKKNATIGFINNFGQIPKQLFKKPHPSKKITNRTSIIDPGPIMPGLSYSLDKLFFHNLDNLEPSKHAVKDVKGPVGHIVFHEKTLMAVEQHKVLVPPLYSRYVAWGFADHSIRIGPYEMERALFVWEDTPSGEILCCAAPNDKIIITAGTNSMVTVWHYDKKKLTIKKNLYGHTEPITCLAASRAYNLIVSGSRDRTCILWDLSRLVFVRQLLGHPAPVAAIAINEVTGDIATCAGTHLFLWSINGDEIASVNTATGRADRTQQILCVAFSYLNEWDNQNVIMTGSSDGVVRMWSADYVQIPEDTCLSVEEESKTVSTDKKEDQTDSKEAETEVETKAAEIVRRMSLAGSKDIGELIQRSTLCATDHKNRFTKSASGSSLSEEEKDDEDFEDLGEEENLKSPVNSNEVPKDSLIPTQIQHSKTVSHFHSKEIEQDSKEVAKTKKLVHSEHFEYPPEHPSNVQRCSTVGPEVTNQSSEEMVDSASSKMRLSKSDTSLTDSFVMISDNDALDNNGSAVRVKKKKKVLKDGFKWHCQLVFRSKLTMHTAFDRSDNTEPAAITALAVSRDHKTVYVGDARGRVFSWSVTDKPGRGLADHWVRDEGGDNCTACGVRFSFSERRHHCRNCGQLFCSRCSRFESEINRLRILKPVRVCQGCYNVLKSQQESSTAS